VYKTLVVRGDRTGVLLACVPGTASLSLRALARASGNKKVDMVEVEEIHRLTGYLRGGVSPLGAKKAYPVFLDSAALAHPLVSISAGMRGMQILVAPRDLLRAAAATAAAIGEPNASA
jgi:Cys-tRNA(Pro)/Cys-tRNA(Cys) deacylase